MRAWGARDVMNLYEARNLAVELMRHHGLDDWTFRFDRARRRFGSCQPRRKLVTLSRALTLLNGIDQVRDTLLHEIAHALTPGDNHGDKWRAKCLEIGAKPERCYTHEEVIAPPRREARYRIGCPKCNWWAERRRLVARQLVCRTCRSDVIYEDRPSGRRFSIVRSPRGRLRLRLEAI
jgi:predicted SprT family Zn-dependent metalloprotease